MKIHLSSNFHRHDHHRNFFEFVTRRKYDLSNITSILISDFISVFFKTTLYISRFKHFIKRYFSTVKRRFLHLDRRREVYFSLIKWLRYREKRAHRTTLQLGAVCVSIHSNSFSPLLAHFPPSLLSFLGSLSVYTGFNGALISRNSVWHVVWPAEKEEKERKEKLSRDFIGGLPSEDENWEYARFKTRIAYLIRSGQARFGIRSLNNAF